jgi:hypothetical protein
MENSHSFEKFKEEIIKHAVSKDFKTAMSEYYFSEITRSIENNHCICGHLIKETSYVINTLNKNILEVGSVCINKFASANKTLQRMNKFASQSLKRIENYTKKLKMLKEELFETSAGNKKPIPLHKIKFDYETRDITQYYINLMQNKRVRED